jgi:hypothetical protein
LNEQRINSQRGHKTTGHLIQEGKKSETRRLDATIIATAK